VDPTPTPGAAAALDPTPPLAGFPPPLPLLPMTLPMDVFLKVGEPIIDVRTDMSQLMLIPGRIRLAGQLRGKNTNKGHNSRRFAARLDYFYP